MSEPVFNVLFLCTGNSARSIFAESILNHLGGGHFVGFSAGSYPRGEVHPRALEVLPDAGLPTAGLRSKSWDEFATPADPTATQGSDSHRLHAFRTAFVELDNSIKLFMNLPLKALDRMKIREHLDAIGKGESAAAVA